MIRYECLSKENRCASSLVNSMHPTPKTAADLNCFLASIFRLRFQPFSRPIFRFIIRLRGPPEITLPKLGVINCRSLVLLPAEVVKICTYEGQVGFDFLGYEVRQYRVGKTHSKQGFKTIIKPSKEAQIRQSHRIREIVKAHQSAAQADLIGHLNPIIRGWANYYSNACSKATYSSMDNLIYLKLRAWARRRHRNKNQHWIAHKPTFRRLMHGEKYFIGYPETPTV